MQTIKKRNGQMVDFDPQKIEIAIGKAFFAARGLADGGLIKRITDDVIADLNALFPSPERIPTVEMVQDIVERKIMQAGFFDVAKAYIIYRYEHAKERAVEKQKVLEKIEEHALRVVKRSGAVEPFSIEKIKRALAFAARGMEDTIDSNALAEQCRNEVYDNISTSEIARSLVMVARSFIEQDPTYSLLASRLLRAKLYKEVIGPDIEYAHFADAYREAFIRNIRVGVEIGRLSPKMLEFDLEAVAAAIDPNRDDLLRYLGVQVLYDRYFFRDLGDEHVYETPQAFWMRVAMGLALNEPEKNVWAQKFYDMLSTFRYVPSTPTLFHAGMPKAQLASCFLNTVGDDLTQIFKSYGDNAQLLKWSGGMGTDWSSVRATGAFIQSTNVESQGIIPFLKIANDVTISINRSGRRRGAGCVYLETWHYDIEDFLELRKNTGDERRRTHDMNTASWIPDLFMKRVRDDGDWTLFSPDEVRDLHETYGRTFEERYVLYEAMADKGEIRLWKRMKARDLWKKMLAMLFETGHPWVTFKDPSNIRSPQDHVGIVHNSNLCTEITLNTSQDEIAVCNLGWINMATHVTNGMFDKEKVAETVRLGMRMLDNVIDANYYPVPETQRSNMRHRPVGLGMGGFQDALYMMGVAFDSEAAVEFADSSMEVIAYHAYLASTDLARERGAYETFKGSKWDRGILPLDTLDLLEQERGEKVTVSRRSALDWNAVRAAIKEHGMRNSNCLAIAPTATTSNIVGSVPSIEPIYKNIYVKANMSGDFTIVNPYLVEDLKKLRLWNKDMLAKLKFHDGNIARIPGIPEYVKEKYKETFQINPRWLIRAAAHRGKWIDQSQSLNIFFTGSSGKLLSEVYQYAWEAGLKTTYYLRTLAASQVEKSTVSATEFGSTHMRSEPVSSVSVARTAVTEILPDAVITAASTTVTVETPVIPVPIEEQQQAHAGPPLCKIEDPSCESCQ